MYVFYLLDKDLGLDSSLILNAQTSSPTMSEKSEVESLLVTERQFDKVQQGDLTLKDTSTCYEHTATDLPSVSGGQWALDALRNCKYRGAASGSMWFGGGGC